MASELRVNTLKDASGNNSIGMSYVAEGSAKAWVNFNGTGTVAVRDSFSVSGVTDNGTGDYTVTISPAFGNANYSCAGAAQQGDTSGNRGDFYLGLHQTAQTTTTRRVSICDSNGTATDGLIGNLQIWGDLA
jgi:hypothetical protein